MKINLDVLCELFIFDGEDKLIWFFVDVVASFSLMDAVRASLTVNLLSFVQIGSDMGIAEVENFVLKGEEI